MNFLNLLHPNLKHSYDSLKDTSSANYAFFKSLINVLQTQEDDTIKSKIQSHLNTATGSFLDEWGAWIGSRRQNNQSDKEYRLWLIRYMTLHKGSKTAIIDAIKIFFNMYDAYIKIKEPYTDVFRLDSGTLDGTQHLSGDYYRWGIIDVVVDRPVPKAIYSLIQEFKPAGVNFYVTIDTSKYGKNKILEMDQDISFNDLRKLFVGFDKTISFSLSTAGNDKYTVFPQWFVLDQSKLDSWDILAGDSYLAQATTISATPGPFIYGASKYGSPDLIGDRVAQESISNAYDPSEWSWGALGSKNYYDHFRLEITPTLLNTNTDSSYIGFQYLGTLDDGSNTDGNISSQPLPSKYLNEYFTSGVNIKPDIYGRCRFYMTYNIQAALLDLGKAYWLTKHPTSDTQISYLLPQGLKEVRYSWVNTQNKDDPSNSIKSDPPAFDDYGNLIVSIIDNNRPLTVSNVSLQISFKDTNSFEPTINDDRTYITSFGDGISADNLELLGNATNKNGLNLHTNSDELYTINKNKVNDGSVIGTHDNNDTILYLALDIGKQLEINYPDIWSIYNKGDENQTLKDIIDTSSARWNIEAKSRGNNLTLGQWDKVGLAMYNFTTSQWDYVNLLNIPPLSNINEYLTQRGYMFIKLETNGVPLELYGLGIQGTLKSNYLPLKVFTDISMEIGYANS